MRIQRTVCGAGLLLGVLALSGCGDESGMSEVSGNVRVDGKPLPSGAIRFEPVDGKTQVTGGMIREGRYSVQVPHGAMKVSISAPLGALRPARGLAPPKPPPNACVR